jgi:hypothetical protein
MLISVKAKVKLDNTLVLNVLGKHNVTDYLENWMTC